MSIDLPASVKRDLERYAEAERITPTEAATNLLQNALKAKKRQASKGEITEEEWQQLRTIPMFAFLERLPESAIDSIEAASRQTRAERFKSRA